MRYGIELLRMAHAEQVSRILFGRRRLEGSQVCVSKIVGIPTPRPQEANKCVFSSVFVALLTISEEEDEYDIPRPVTKKPRFKSGKIVRWLVCS